MSKRFIGLNQKILILTTAVYFLSMELAATKPTTRFSVTKETISQSLSKPKIFVAQQTDDNDGATIVNFRDAFKNIVDGVRVIDVDPFDEILFIPKGIYVLGQDLNAIGLDLSAGRIRLEGDVVIRAFTRSIKPPANSSVAATGQQGNPGGADGGHGGNGGVGWHGNPGRNGSSAKRITLRISKIEGPGRLIIFNNGTYGGIGGKGGKGGPGGVGGRGKGRGVNAFCSGVSRPANGGSGGNGGRGGVGGIGGRGGDGGTIVYRKSLQNYISHNKLILRAPGADGGLGGPGGLGGDRGHWGDGGPGSRCGGGGQQGNWGAWGAPGPKGQRGQKGKDGSILAN